MNEVELREEIINAIKGGSGVEHYLYLVEGAIRGIKNDELRSKVQTEYETKRKKVRVLSDIIPLVESLLLVGERNKKLANSERLERFTEITKTFASLPKFSEE